MVKFINAKLGIFVNRYKRFFATINIEGKDRICYCPNTGKMADILTVGNECIVSSINTKTEICWQAIKQQNTWVGVNTLSPNKIAHDLLPSLFKEKLSAEKKFGSYRADFANESKIVEVKHVHWKQGDFALFPDCITERGTRQMTNLIELQSQGYKCFVIYILQRNDLNYVSVSDVDIKYKSMIGIAKKSGIQFLAFNCNITIEGLSMNKQIEVVI